MRINATTVEADCTFYFPMHTQREQVQRWFWDRDWLPKDSKGRVVVQNGTVIEPWSHYELATFTQFKNGQRGRHTAHIHFVTNTQ